jgi:hypothetical protein
MKSPTLKRYSKCGKIAATGDQDDAGKRKHHAEQLPRPKALAVEQKRESDQHQRAGRLKDHRIDDFGVSQVSERVVGGDARK